jgi:hypothetical protein
MKRCVGVNTCESTGVFALDWSLWVVRDLSCYLVHHLVILSRPDPPRPTELSMFPPSTVPSTMAGWETRQVRGGHTRRKAGARQSESSSPSSTDLILRSKFLPGPEISFIFVENWSVSGFSAFTNNSVTSVQVGFGRLSSVLEGISQGSAGARAVC